MVQWNWKCSFTSRLLLLLLLCISVTTQLSLTIDKTTTMSMDKAMEKGVPAIQMLGFYLEQIRTGIVEGTGGLSLAIYDFMRNKQAESSFLDTRYDFGVNMMKALLQYGQQRGEFKPCNLQTEAEHIVIFLDGLQTASAVIPFSDEVISRQFNNILERIKTEEW